MSDTDPSDTDPLHAPRVAPTGNNAFLKLVGAISSLCGWVAATLILLSVAVTCEMIFVRGVLNQSTIWQTEAVVYMMVTATLLGLPYVQRLRGHVNVDLLPMILAPGARKILTIVTLLAAIIVIGVVLYYGVHMWYEAFSRNWTSDTVWGVRLWIPYLAVPVGIGLYLLQMIADLYAVVMDIDRNFGISEH